jgi:hypothetical protein
MTSPATTAPVPSATPDAAPTRAHAAMPAATVTFNERTVRQVLLLRAFESQNTEGVDNPLWTQADSQWASRVASDTVGLNKSPAAFIEARAQAAMQRLAPRDANARRALEARAWRWGWLPVVALIALVLGAIVYDVGTHQRIDLLAVSVWALVVWNLVVMVGLLLLWLKRLASGPGKGGRLRKFIGAQLATKVSGVSRKTPALAAYATAWSKASWPMTLARAGAVLHLGAAALALGLIAGMYLRGLVLDYRAGWQSTFLEPPAVHAVLSTVLKPASVVTGVPVPDAAGIAALRLLPGQEAKGEARSWIHLMAATLALLVVLPRLLLALGSLLRGSWLARRMPLAIDEPYHQRVLQHHGANAARVRIHPHGTAPDATGALGLQKLVTRVFGEKAELAFAPVATYGSEDTASVFESDTVKLAFFDLSATPEVEAQGRHVQALKARAARGTTVVMVVDEAAFNSRFGGVSGLGHTAATGLLSGPSSTSERADQRRAAWRAMAEKINMPTPVFLNLAAMDVESAARAMEAAMRQFDAAS